VGGLTGSPLDLCTSADLQRRLTAWKKEVARKDRVFSFLCWAHDTSPASDAKLYELIAEEFPKAKIYPSLPEQRVNAGKLVDIRTLDEIAAHETKFENTYRPVTCMSTDKCIMDDKVSVMKRSHSSCSNQVILQPSRADMKRLPCRSRNSSARVTRSQISEDKPVWFHQGKVETLQTVGEYGS
jgi:hypothetical protein